MKGKLKLHLINLYILQAGGQERMTAADWKRLGRGVEWRNKIIDALLANVRRQLVDADQIPNFVANLMIQRQIEDELAMYSDDLVALSEKAVAGEISQDEFEDELIAITMAILMIAFLVGSVIAIDQLNEAQRLIFDAATVVLNSNVGGDQTLLEQAQFNSASAVLMNPFFTNDAFTPEQMDFISGQLDISSESAASIAQAIADGTFDGVAGQEVLATRMSMWVGTAVMMFSYGQTFRADNPFFLWKRNVLKMSCSDCLRLDQQVHTAEEWRAANWIPRSTRLICFGVFCGCLFIETVGPSQGGF